MALVYISSMFCFCSEVIKIIFHTVACENYLICMIIDDFYGILNGCQYFISNQVDLERMFHTDFAMNNSAKFHRPFGQ